jgi:hypothetical protein
MKKFGSSIERVEGTNSPRIKEDIFRIAEKKFSKQAFRELADKEREKTPEEAEIIAIINKITDEVREDFGLEKFDVPAKNFHIVEKDKWGDLIREEGTEGTFVLGEQAVFMSEHISRLVFLERSLHEMIHFKSYHARQVISGRQKGDGYFEIRIGNYRVGLECCGRSGEELFLTNLNEAVTEEMTKLLFKSVIAENSSLFDEEIYETNKIKKKLPAYDKDEVYWLFLHQKTGEWRGFVYPEQRKNLNLLVDKIFAKNLDKFKSRDEVFDIFAKAMLDGNIMPLGRLLEKSFARPGRKLILRQLAELDSDIEKQREFIESL